MSQKKIIKKEDEIKEERAGEDGAVPIDVADSELKAKCKEYLAGWQRAKADYANLLKETAQQRVEWIRNANAGLIISLLPILDNFKMAFKLIPENEKNSAWVVGFAHIMKQLEGLLAENGVEQIKTEGEKFDHAVHEAVGQEICEDKDEDVVLEEKKAGYKLNGKVIQVAKVVVNSKDKK